LNEPARSFLDRYFTKVELAAAGDGATQTQRLAGRFAVKEAVMKALGMGWGHGVSFTDVEVITLETGAPTVYLRRKLASLEQERAIVQWFVSVSHTSTVAVASVIAVSDG
jgi:holo-[acyl-carrier protein] synthase